MDTLAPAERLAFVLHDRFGVPFSEIAAVLNRSADAAKMLASRARRRIRVAHARPTLVDGSVGIAVTPHGRLAVVMTFTLTGDRIAQLGIVAEPQRLQGLRLIMVEVMPVRPWWLTGNLDHSLASSSHSVRYLRATICLGTDGLLHHSWARAPPPRS